MSNPEDDGALERTADGPRDWLDIREAAKHAGVSVATFRIMVSHLPIPFVRPTGPKSDRRFWRADIDSALRSKRENLPKP